MSIWNVINLAGGLAMFIFGMNLMSDGLKLVAGSYLKKNFGKTDAESHHCYGCRCWFDCLDSEFQRHVCHGGWFCECRYEQLERSVGILMGAKIGTTITGQLIAFNISEIAPVIAFIGVADYDVF